MELIYISDSQLKIILSYEDLKAYNITSEKIEYTNVSTKNLIWSLLKSAKEETNFNADNSRLSVTVFTSSDGGCEIYITKVKNNKCESSMNKTKIYRNKTVIKNRDKYIVSELSALCKLCKRMISDKFHMNTNLYYTMSGNYILTIKIPQKHPSYVKSISKFINPPEYLSEYGSVYDLTDKDFTYIKEYCKILSKNHAAEQLSKL